MAEAGVSVIIIVKGVIMQNKFDQAIEFAVNAHSGMKRKGKETPYIVHPLEALTIASTLTDDVNVLCAAVLHDTVEDSDTTISDIKELFGDKVARLVASDSENKREDLPASETWEIRKTETLKFLEKAEKDEQIIALSDKLSNMRAIYRDYQTLGEELWKRFNIKEKQKHAWYYCGIAERLKDLTDTFAYKEYVELIKKVFGENLVKEQMS